MRLLGKIDEDADVINRKYVDDRQVVVNNGQLTIQKNGTNVATFTANQSSNSTANITVPTKTSELTNDSNFIVNSNSYINTHPENSPVVIPFIHNDISFLLLRGGSAKVYYDSVEQSVGLGNVFDGSPSYWAINPTGVTEIVIELTLHKAFGWTNTIYCDFGSSGWRSKNVKIEVINSNYADDTWSTKLNLTNNASGNVKCTFSHTPVGAANAGAGFNKIRFTYSSWGTATIFRIAQLGVYNYGSLGVRETYMSRGLDDYLFRNITPNSTNTYNLGDSSHKWKNVYATTFTGNLTGNVTGNLTGTASKATGDKNGDDITTTYYKASNPNGYTSNTGTVTSVTLKATSPISIDSSSAITTSGTRTLSHANSGVTAGTYKSVTVNATGHVTAGTNPTTLSGYGITDAKIASGTITLGSNTITPLTSHQSIKTINNNTMTGTGNVSVGTITGVSVNGTSVATSGVANITSIPSNIVTPAITKTYTGIIGDASSNTLANNAFFFGSVRPTSFTGGWSVTYRVHIWVPSNSNFDAVSEVHFFGDQASINSYAIFNHIYSTSYRPAYYHTIARLKSAGYTAGYGHALAVNLADSNSRGDTNLTRTLVVEVLEQNNCTVTLNNTAVKWASWPGTGTTNYNDPGNYNFSANGMQESGDNDTTYQLRSYYERPLVDTGKLYGYNLCTLTNNNKLTGFVNSYSTGNTKTKNTATFMIDAPIFYYGTSTEKAANTYPADNTMYLNTSSIDLRYSTNCAQTLTANKPVYLVGIPSGATYTLADTWWTQTLPTTDDGKIYIYLGVTYSTYQIAWQPEHPVYWFKNGKLRLYTDTQGTSIENAWYCTCTTAANTAAKVLTCSESGFTLKEGTVIAVAFTNTNTASSVTLNVNSSGAKSISDRGTVYTGNDSEMTGYAGRILYYMYNGTTFDWLNIFAESFNKVNNAGNATNLAVVAASSYNPANYPNNTIIITY